LKNGGSFHSFLIFLLTFTRGSSPTLCIGFWGYLSWRCLPNSSHICTLTKTGFIHVPSRQGRGFTDPWYFVGKSHGKCPSHLTRQHFFFRPGFKNEESYYLLLYPLVNVHITMERSTIFQWENSTISMAIFNSKLLVYQRVPDLGGITIITYYNHP